MLLSLMLPPCHTPIGQAAALRPWRTVMLLMALAVVGGCATPRSESAASGSPDAPVVPSRPADAGSGGNSPTQAVPDATDNPIVDGGAKPDLPERPPGTSDASMEATPGCSPGQKSCGKGVCIATDLCCAGAACQVPHGAGICGASGLCQDVVCASGFADCVPGVPGCESPLDTNQDCGACNHTCRQSETCEGGQCRCPLVCGTNCVDPAKDRNNCGQCGHQCFETCTAGHCECPTPKPANLEKNGGFDIGAANWSPFPFPDAFTLAKEDAAECSASGSIVVTDPNLTAGRQVGAEHCVGTINPLTRYNFGAWTKLRRGTALCMLIVEWYQRPNCERRAEDVLAGSQALARTPIPGVWQHAESSDLPYAGAVSANIRVYVFSDHPDGTLASCGFDMVYLTPAPGTW
jgi:hypothetical protein